MYKTYFCRSAETENTYASTDEIAFSEPMSEIDALKFVNALNEQAEICTYWIKAQPEVL